MTSVYGASCVMATLKTIYEIVDELRALASQGLTYARDDYDRERYERVLALGSRLIANAENRDAEEVLAQFRGNLAQETPLAGTDVAIFREDRLLLIKRHDTKLWATPGGASDVGETLAEGAVREAREEIGCEVEVTRLLAVFDSRLWHSLVKSQLYHVMFEARIVNGEPQVSAEALEIDYFAENDLPELHYGHRHWVPFVFELVRGEVAPPYFDTPDSPYIPAESP